MIHVDEEDPIGEVELSFPYRNVTFRRNIDPKEIYDLQSEIGRGKFGTVYKCKEKQSGLHLAAKFITVPKKEDRRNVEREVEIMRQLQHPRLIQVYDAFENGKIMTVILELIEGGELFERVIDDDFVLTEKSCAVFMRQICEGIDFIHKQNILHLDMKPENILCLTKTGNRIKIIDFGLARKYDPDKKLQVLFGTPEFVAPEVVNFDQIGFGTDMWSVGVICYVLLSGLSPFMGHTDVETMANVTVAKYDFDDDAFQDISEHAIDFIKKLLLKDIKQRLSAHHCLNHVWLKRPLPQPQTVIPAQGNRHNNRHMGMTKDNLRQFVERWSEHPNSPYVFELTSHSILPNCLRYNGLYGSQESLVGLSPSPCGSLASSPGSDFADYLYLNLPPQNDFRRASDSSCIVKTPDITERVNLAEEIKKLSDKLLQLSTLPTIPIEPISNNFESTSKSKELNIKNGRSNQPSSSVNIPWRKPKFKVTSMNRDVPLTKSPPSLHSSRSFKDCFQSKLSHFKEECTSENGFVNNERKVVVTRSSTTNSSPNDTKDLLLQLLGQWEGPPKVSVKRHGSISTDWSETESLGQRTISSLNTFFQSRSTNKKISQFKKQ